MLGAAMTRVCRRWHRSARPDAVSPSMFHPAAALMAATQLGRQEGPNRITHLLCGALVDRTWQLQKALSGEGCSRVGSQHTSILQQRNERS